MRQCLLIRQALNCGCGPCLYFFTLLCHFERPHEMPSFFFSIVPFSVLRVKFWPEVPKPFSHPGKEYLSSNTNYRQFPGWKRGLDAGLHTAQIYSQQRLGKQTLYEYDSLGKDVKKSNHFYCRLKVGMRQI